MTPRPSPHDRALSDDASSRRAFLQRCGTGLGALGLSSLLSGGEGDATAKPTTATNPLAPRQPHFAAKAKRVIYIMMAGGPSQLDLYDFKPELLKRSGQLPPADLLKNYRAAFINPNSALLGPRFSFARHGACGMELSELLPHLGGVADDICLIKSMQTDAVNHAPAQILLNTGSQQFGRPSLGAWTIYGLGSEATNLPGYVVLSSAKGTSGGAGNWGCGFLPTIYSGIPFRSSGDAIPYLSNPRGLDVETQSASLEALRALNAQSQALYGDPETSARSQAYDMANRLQSSAPELMDLSHEPKEVLELYGVDPAKPGFARNCLVARRLIERGVRFVQLCHEAWDQHGNLVADLRKHCLETDQASAALVADLKRLGLLEDTLIVWAGEFGRTPMVQGTNDGRDHHNRAFSVWMSGGGVKRGMTFGGTDELGFNAVENPVHVHDLNATILQLLGFDHTRLTFRSQGRDFRLTDVHGSVVKEILL